MNQNLKKIMDEYMETNDFLSGLRPKGIYTDEIILGWIKSTFEFAYKAAIPHVREEILKYLRSDPMIDGRRLELEAGDWADYIEEELKRMDEA